MMKSKVQDEPLRRLRAAAAASALALAPALATAAPHSAGAQEEYRLSGREVAVYNLAGTATVVEGEGPDVVVQVTRGGADGARLRVESGQVGGREALRVIYPDDRVVYRRMGRSNTTVRVRSDGTFFGGRRGGQEVRISGSGRGTEAHADLLIRVPHGGSVAVHVAAGDGRARGVEADVAFDTGSGSVEVADIRGSVSVDTGSGAVRIRGVEGDVFADTGSGSIHLEGIVGERLEADTGSGHVEGQNLELAELVVDTGSGSIRLRGLAVDEAECDTGSGSIHLGLVSDVDHLVVDTGSGSVTVEVPSEFGADLELDTSSGRIDVGLETTSVSVSERDHFRGLVGDGNGRVIIDTGSGGITIREM